MIGPLWPSSWEAMIVDLDYYKEKIDFSNVDVYDFVGQVGQPGGAQGLGRQRGAQTVA